MSIALDVSKLVGGTPMVYLQRIAEEENILAKIALKLESQQPMNSVKDRIAVSMIDDAEEKGLIERGKTVFVEPTSGNTGIGIAMVAASRGYKCVLVMPETVSLERRMVLLALGAEVVLTPKDQGLPAVLRKAKQLLKEIPHAYELGQFTNPANPLVHFKTTGPEIWQATDGQLDIFVSGVGTGGTITGCMQYFNSQGRKVHAVAVEPAESPVLSGGKPGPHGIQGIGAGFVPPVLQQELINEIQKVTTPEAIEMARRLSLTEGLFVGISAGAAVHAAVQLAKREENREKLIVAVVPSFGERYFSTNLFSDFKKQAEEMIVQRVDMSN